MKLLRKKELETQELPKTWEEYCENNYRIGYYLNCGSRISSFNESARNNKLRPTYDKNTLESKENAEAILALCQLIRLRDEYNRHEPINYENERQIYAVIYDDDNNCYKTTLADKQTMYRRLFVFRNKELAQEYIKNFKSLLDKFYKLMY